MPDPSGDLTSYVEIAEVLGYLPVLTREARRARQLSQRAAARELGLSFATVSRVEAGEDCALSTATAVLRWLATPMPSHSAVGGEPEATSKSATERDGNDVTDR